MIIIVSICIKAKNLNPVKKLEDGVYNIIVTKFKTDERGNDVN
jgi:hypothetical protein